MTEQTGKRRTWRYWRNLILFALVVIIGAYFLVELLILPVIGAHVEAYPNRLPLGEYTPADLNLTYEEVSFPASDGLTIKGWYVEPLPGTENGAAVIIAHGLGGNRSAHIKNAPMLVERGYGVLLIDQRAHGESDGDMVTYAGEDILGAADFLMEEKGIEPGKIGAWGFSHGARNSAQAGAVTDAIGAFVLDGMAPGNLDDVPSSGGFLTGIWARVYFGRLDAYGVTAPMGSTEAVSKLAPRPVLLIAGGADADEVAIVQNYFENAGKPKEYWAVPGAGHTGGWDAESEEYERRAAAIFEAGLLSE
jgi:pimeloyl-ACP methyl ester carboxylesterase